MAGYNLALGSAAFLTQFSESANLLMNSSFEDGFDSWEILSGAPDVAVSRGGVTARDGGQFATGGAVNISKIRQSVVFSDDEIARLQAGAGLSLSLLVSSYQGIDYPRVSLEFVNSDGVKIEYDDSFKSIWSARWARRGFVVYDIDVSSVDVVIEFVRQSGTYNDAYVDDVFFGIV